MAIYNGTQKINVSGVAKVYVGPQLVYQKQAPVQTTPYVLFSSLNTNISLNVIDNTKYWDGTLETSTDNTTWTTWDGTTAVSSNTGNLYVRGSNNTFITGSTASTTKAIWQLTGTDISISGNIEALLDYQTVAGGSMIATPANSTFESLFNKNYYIINAQDLELPRTTLINNCYHGMFTNCTGLTTVPQLPATTLASSCYYQMFYGCTSLTSAPTLPATTLADNCYYQMFCNCTSLTTAPALPATTLAEACYYSMFNGCTSLINTPALPATTLAQSCYRQMFYGCTSLATLPALPATTLPRYSYQSMFNGCSNIKLSTTQTSSYVNAYRIPTTGSGSGSSALSSMFSSTGGTFTGTPSINTTYYTSNNIINS